MKFLIFMTSLSVLMVIKSANSMMIRNLMFNPIDRLTPNDEILPFDGRKFLDPRELIRISIKKISNDDELNATDVEGKQIPVISDIERIKKVVRIIEFVGEKVGELIDKIDLPASSLEHDERKATIDLEQVEVATEAN